MRIAGTTCVAVVDGHVHAGASAGIAVPPPGGVANATSIDDATPLIAPNMMLRASALTLLIDATVAATLVRYCPELFAWQRDFVPILFISSDVVPPSSHVTPKRVQRNDCKGPNVAESAPSTVPCAIEQSSSLVSTMTA